MVATQRDSFYPSDRTQSRLLPVKIFRPKCEGGYLDEDQLDSELIGKSEVMQALKKSIRLVADSSETVLITGETGTGKELIARAIHNQSLRRTKSFLAVNCGALNESVLESELFGHVKGAFTGATTNKKGFFEVASGGTLFLDEFAEMSMATQQRLLQVHSPALRDRKEDIPALANYFIQKYNRHASAAVCETIPPRVLAALQTYSWAGNVRELENIVKRLAVSAAHEGSSITSSLLQRVPELRECLEVTASVEDFQMNTRRLLEKRIA